MNDVKPEPNWAFKMIEIIHDNPIMRRFRNPYKLLKAAGIQKGMKVLEVGCGPGVFTIPAAELVGEEGVVYAVDIHPLAIKKVKKKIQNRGVNNVIPILANAAKIELPNESVDLIFIFGLGHAAGGLEPILREAYRLLRPEGMLAYEKGRRYEKELIRTIESIGFEYVGKEDKILKFKKIVSG